MKAFRNIGGTVVEIQIDLDLDGNPILPPDTTTDPRPEAEPNHYVTVVGRNWVQIPVTVQIKTLETIKAEKLAEWDVYRKWLLEQPSEYQGILFDADETARIRLTQAVTVAKAGAQVPPAWVTYDNSTFPLTDLAALEALTVHIVTAFGTRFFEANAIREAILQASDEAGLAAVAVPSIPNPFTPPIVPAEEGR